MSDSGNPRTSFTDYPKSRHHLPTSHPCQADTMSAMHQCSSPYTGYQRGLVTITVGCLWCLSGCVTISVPCLLDMYSAGGRPTMMGGGGGLWPRPRPCLSLASADVPAIPNMSRNKSRVRIMFLPLCQFRTNSSLSRVTSHDVSRSSTISVTIFREYTLCSKISDNHSPSNTNIVSATRF